MKQEDKGELIGQLVICQKKIDQTSVEVYKLSTKVECLLDKLCKVTNEEYVSLIQDAQYTLGKIKGILR